MENGYFNFGKVSKAQKKAIEKIESAESEFIYQMRNIPQAPQFGDALKVLRKARNLCNAAILFHWNENKA